MEILGRRLYSAGEYSIAPIAIPDHATVLRLSLDRTALPNTTAELVSLELDFFWSVEWRRDYHVAGTTKRGELITLCYSGWRTYGIAGGQTKHARSMIELTPKNLGLPMSAGRSLRGRLIVHTDCVTDLQVELL